MSNGLRSNRISESQLARTDYGHDSVIDTQTTVCLIFCSFHFLIVFVTTKCSILFASTSRQSLTVLNIFFSLSLFLCFSLIFLPNQYYIFRLKKTTTNSIRKTKPKTNKFSKNKRNKTYEI